MADQDSDRWIFEVLAPDLRRKMKSLENEHPWTDLVFVLIYPSMQGYLNQVQCSEPTRSP